ncbi:MAG TPA: hypothetical protein PLM89_08930, partial [Anaerolineales bacterium]|nr:hypothetical protein [Anaerolineales bacterium]
DDAVPALAAGFQNTTLPDRTRERIGAALACRLHDREQNESMRPWQGFNLSTFLADRAFVEIKGELEAYAIMETDYPLTIRVPSGEEIPCWTYYYD